MSRVLFRKLRRDLLQRKGALSALLLIVMIGIGCFAAMSTLYRDLDRARRQYYAEYRVADFTVDLKRAPESAVASLKDLPNVASAEGRVSIAVRIALPGSVELIGGQAISLPEKRRPILNDVLLKTGTWFSGPDEKEVILNEAFARANGLWPGERIRVLLLDREHDLLVVGTAMSPEFVYLIPASGGLAPDPARFGVMYLPERFLRAASDLDGACNQVVGRVFDRSAPALLATLSQIERSFDRYGVTQTTPYFNQPSIQFLADELTGLKTSALVMPLIFLAVAALVLNILMGRMVAQQRLVIGTLKALGVGNGRIARHYLAFGAVVGLIGGLLGALFGLVIQQAMLGLYRELFALPEIVAHLHIDLLVACFLISVLFSILGTIKGLRLAVRLLPAEALRPSLPEAGRHILPERWTAFWRRLSFNQKMILRTVFRNPFRSSVGLAAAIVATALMVASLGINDGLDSLMDHQFEKVAHEDIRLTLREPVAPEAAAELADLPELKGVEPQLLIPADLARGARAKRTAILGLPRGNRLYTPLAENGEPAAIPERGLLLDRKLAEILGAKTGDTLRIRPLLGRREEAAAPIAAVVDSYLGLSAYASIDYLSGLIGESSASNVLLASLWHGEASKPLLEEIRQRPEVLGISRRLRSFEQLDETFGKTMGGIIGILVLFAGMIAFGSVLNSALVSMSEREREVGTLRVVGYGPGRIARIFVGESLLLNGAGVLLGLPAGLLLNGLISAAYSTELYRFPAGVEPLRLLQSAALMFVFLGVAQLFIIVLIRKLRWLDVLNIRE
ncbi:MAG: FtsX-like permease family protein [Planctomycetota bacterium]